MSARFVRFKPFPPFFPKKKRPRHKGRRRCIHPAKVCPSRRAGRRRGQSVPAFQRFRMFTETLFGHSARLLSEYALCCKVHYTLPVLGCQEGRRAPPGRGGGFRRFAEFWAPLPGKITVCRPVQMVGPSTCTVPSSYTVMVMPSCTKSRNSSPRQSMTGI